MYILLYYWLLFIPMNSLKADPFPSEFVANTFIAMLAVGEHNEEEMLNISLHDPL